MNAAIENMQIVPVACYLPILTVDPCFPTTGLRCGKDLIVDHTYLGI